MIVRFSVRSSLAAEKISCSNSMPFHRIFLLEGIQVFYLDCGGFLHFGINFLERLDALPMTTRVGMEHRLRLASWLHNLNLFVVD